ncbi:thiol-disulfide oxidoreductase DCC family protein [Idiomarina sp. ST10R2A5]|uniref:thiol-disulfide oxidoreductase DCC family protein n=1 Tax=Idiomarina sp. ST10R2A5 TaxID=3418368 RepID=UPI003EC75B2D
MQNAQLIIFYDGGCPLCVKEMRHLKRLDKEGRIQFENVNDPDFSQRYPQVEVAKANQYLHGQTRSGEMIYGLDVTHEAWSLVGKGWMIAPLRWPVIRWFADKAYLFFARHRNRISKLLTGEERCSQCSID